jgi:CRISPR-associated protein Cmr4
VKKIKRGEKEVLVRIAGSDAELLFGQEEYKEKNEPDVHASSGVLLIGEARVLAFPVRSAKGSFAWITCPLVLQRYARDIGGVVPIELPSLCENECLSAKAVMLDSSVVLEEYRFEFIGDSAAVAQWMADLISDSVWKEMPERLVVLNNEMFSYFCEQACEVVSHVRIDDVTGTAVKGALFNQEQVPSETLFYSVLFFDEKRCADTQAKLKEKLKDGILQIGGDASTGLGFCSVEVK